MQRFGDLLWRACGHRHKQSLKRGLVRRLLDGSLQAGGPLAEAGLIHCPHRPGETQLDALLDIPHSERVEGVFDDARSGHQKLLLELGRSRLAGRHLGASVAAQLCGWHSPSPRRIRPARAHGVLLQRRRLVRRAAALPPPARCLAGLPGRLRSCRTSSSLCCSPAPALVTRLRASFVGSSPARARCGAAPRQPAGARCSCQ